MFPPQNEAARRMGLLVKVWDVLRMVGDLPLILPYKDHQNPHAGGHPF